MNGGSDTIIGQFYALGSEDVTWPGVVSIGADASLRLLVTSDLTPGRSKYEELIAGLPIDFIGRTQSNDVISLIRCLYTEGRVLSNYRAKTVTSELCFKPTSIWTGPEPFLLGRQLAYLKFNFTGLHGVIGTKKLAHRLLVSEAERNVVRDLIGETYELFYRDSSVRNHEVELTNLNATIAFGSDFVSTFSWKTGNSVETYDFCDVVSAVELAGDELLSIGSKIERFLSFICLRTIRGTKLELSAAVQSEGPPPQRYARLWHLGAEHKPCEVMFHQALSSFLQEPGAMRTALQRWLAPSDDEFLARWLFLESQDDEAISVGRLIAIFQAVEIMGRAATGAPPFDRAAFDEAASKAATTMCQALGAPFDTTEFCNRFYQLIKTGNRPSFRDGVRAFFEQIPSNLRAQYLPDQDEFVGRVVKMRNIVIHMDNRTRVTEETTRHLGEMTYRLLALFAAHQAVALGLDPDRVLSGLVNSEIGQAANHYINRFQRRGSNGAAPA